MTNSTNPYSDAARDKFTALKGLYSKNDQIACDAKPGPVSFWKLGNTFDTMTDFLEVIDSSSAHDIAQMVVKQLYASLKCIKGSWDGAWFDDFGWWSVATQRALQKPFFKQDTDQFQLILSQCWTRFTNNAPFVWQRNQNPDFKNYGPAVNGGVWNAYWIGTSDIYPGPKNGDPTSGSLIGIQNTVTNALYLMAAHRLGYKDPNAREADKKALTFLLTWLDPKMVFPTLWWKVNDNAGLIRERVGSFASKEHDTGYQDDWAWTGDQGLTLGNISDAMNHLAPGFRGDYIARAKALIAGVIQKLTDGGVVTNYTLKDGHVPDGDVGDYQVGSGVFWRNALYAWRNSDLQPTLAAPDFQKVLRASADAAKSAPTAGASFETLTNQVAVLVAATAMLK